MADQQIAPAEARTFVQSFVPDPKALESMDDTAVVAYHGRVSEALNKVRPADAWPTSWRENMAKGPDGKVDEKALERLKRFSEPTAVWQSQRQWETKLSNGELRAVPPKDAPPEVMKAWRADAGIPEAPDKYDLKLKGGMVIGEADKAYIGKFLEAAHGRNVSNEQASGMVEAYYGILEQQAQEAAANDKAAASAAAQSLRKDWTGDYERNMNIFHSSLDGAPTGVKEKVLGGRTADGVPLSADPAFIKWVVQRELEANPATTVLPGLSGTALSSGIDAEIADIEKTMKNNRAAYNKDEKMQERLRDLYRARDAAVGKKG